MIYLGNSEIQGIYLGDSEISAIYAGTEQIYPMNLENVTAITISGLTWVTDIDSSGGTATSANCSFDVVALYDSGKTKKVTSESIISGSLVVPATTAATREMVGTLSLTAEYFGLTAIASVGVYQKAYMSYVWVDIRTVNNTTPIYDVGWKTNGSFSGDKWFAELSGLTTDSRGWTSGKSASYGRYTYHRFNSRQYTCNFLPQYDSLGDGYGANGTVMGYSQDYGYGARDVERTTLSTETINGSTYYILGLKNWLDWKPLYVPYSTSKIQSNWSSGLIMVKILA